MYSPPKTTEDRIFVRSSATFGKALRLCFFNLGIPDSPFRPELFSLPFQKFLVLREPVGSQKQALPLLLPKNLRATKKPQFPQFTLGRHRFMQTLISLSVYIYGPKDIFFPLTVTGIVNIYPNLANYSIFRRNFYISRIFTAVLIRSRSHSRAFPLSFWGREFMQASCKQPQTSCKSPGENRVRCQAF